MRRNQRNETSHGNYLELPPYDEIGLVLQGGGALGSYQAGVYEGLAEAGVKPTWISAISIGALNTAIIAGNALEDRVEALRGFWNTVCNPPDLIGRAGAWLPESFGFWDYARKWSSMWAASRAMIEGQNGFFTPRSSLHITELTGTPPSQVSFYDTSVLRETLLKYADFDRINDGDTRISVGAVNVRTGNMTYFDNTKIRLQPEHFMASGALPPGFPALEIDGEFYWDGGLVSNTPLTEIARDTKHKDRLVFQVDLWSATGKLPGNFLNVAERTKDIQYSSRTRLVSYFMETNQNHALLIKKLLEYIPAEVRQNDPLLSKAQLIADGSALNLVHLIYKNKFFEGHYKDFEFSTDTMTEHWQSGLEDIRRSFAHPDWFDIPSHDIGFVSHDVHRTEAPPATAPRRFDANASGATAVDGFPLAHVDDSRVNASFPLRVRSGKKDGYDNTG